MFRALHIALIALLVLTAQNFALARGQTMAAGEIVLCSGGQAVTVAVDAEGKPTGPAHICPDMALSLLAGFDHALPVLRPDLALHSVEVAVDFEAGQAAQTIAPSARGPPVLI